MLNHDGCLLASNNGGLLHVAHGRPGSGKASKNFKNEALTTSVATTAGAQVPEFLLGDEPLTSNPLLDTTKKQYEDHKTLPVSRVL